MWHLQGGSVGRIGGEGVALAGEDETALRRHSTQQRGGLRRGKAQAGGDGLAGGRAVFPEESQHGGGLGVRGRDRIGGVVAAADAEHRALGAESVQERTMAVQKNVIKGILAGTFALMLSGCVTVPDAIKGSSPTPQQDLVRVMSAPQLYVGQEARFGGKVVAVQNQQGKTRLEIATVPLDSGARPTLGEPSRGRIYADVNGFLDPVDFRGQLVTVVGPITGAVDGKIGNTPYKFMVMQVTGYKRWHLTQQVIMPPQPIDPWFYGGRGWPYGYGGWGWYNPGPARVQTVVTE